MDLRAERQRSDASRVRGLALKLRLAGTSPHPDSFAALGIRPLPRTRRAVRGMIHCVTVHARHNRRKPALSGCRDSERSRACAFAVASLDVSLNRLIGDSFRRLLIAWTPRPTTSRSRAGIIWWR